jgi:predicted RNase H-like nuclease (RuvC/YqgF family)
MVSPDRGSSDALEIPLEAQVERLQRRVSALERQLEARIAQVDELRDRLASPQELVAEDRGDDEILRRKAAEYDALMQTFTMRALSRPREWYASARRRLARP